MGFLQIFLPKNSWALVPRVIFTLCRQNYWPITLFHLPGPGHGHHLMWAAVRAPLGQAVTTWAFVLSMPRDDFVHCTFGPSAVLGQWKEWCGCSWEQELFKLAAFAGEQSGEPRQGVWASLNAWNTLPGKGARGSLLVHSAECQQKFVNTNASVHPLKRSIWCLQNSSSAPEQTFALFKVLHCSGGWKKV